MPGGSKGAKAPDNNVNAQIPPWMMNMQPQTLPAFGPGQQQMLASQLAMGGFGNPKSNMAWLDQVYDPATVMSQGPLPKTPVTPPPKPKPTDKKTADDGRWTWNGGRNSR